MDDSKTITTSDPKQNFISDNEQDCPEQGQLLELLKEKNTEIVSLKEQLLQCQSELVAEKSENERLQLKILELTSKQYDEEMGNKTTGVIPNQAPCSVSTDNQDKPMPKWNETNKSSSTSIADLVRETAEGEIKTQEEENCDAASADVCSDYIYDSNSGLYYHPATGYYWDPTSSLFYDYTSGQYYYFNEESKAYEVFSCEDNSLNSHTQKISNALCQPKGDKIKKKSNKSKFTRDRKTGKIRKISKSKLTSYKGKNFEKMLVRTKGEIINSEDESYLKDISEQRREPLEKQTCYDTDSSGSLASGESELISDVESGELISSSSDSDVDFSNDHPILDLTNPEDNTNTNAMANDYPPCIRFIVLESETLQIGALYIVTCYGGSIGREKTSGQALLIPHSSISKVHAQIQYDYDEACYKVHDLGSQNGTWINDHRLSPSKTESFAHILSHGDILQIGYANKLLVHIHKGHETCEECEPGQVQARLKTQCDIKNTYQVLSKEEKKIQQRQELKRIKKKFGLQNSYYETPGSVINNADYEEYKAMLRWKLADGENEIGAQSMPASVHSPIASSNKGHKLLAKMGWKDGKGLGKSSSGITEPINVELRLNQSAGLGSNENTSLSIDNLQEANKMKKWVQAKQRFNRLANDQGTSAKSTGAYDSNQETSSWTSDKSAISVSDSSIVKKDSQKQPRLVWVKGDTQNPS